MINFAMLPPVPKAMRPKKLYVRSTFEASLNKELIAKGWELVDVRFISDPGDAIKCIFEGARTQTIDLSEEESSALLAEARLITAISKAPVEKVREFDVEDMEQLTNFGKPSIGGVIHIVPRLSELESIKVKKEAK